MVCSFTKKYVIYFSAFVLSCNLHTQNTEEPETVVLIPLLDALVRFCTIALFVWNVVACLRLFNHCKNKTHYSRKIYISETLRYDPNVDGR